jgi:hypothetical protein
MKTFIFLVAMMSAFVVGMAYADDDQIPRPGMTIEPVVHSTFDWSLKGQAAADQLASYANDELPVLGSSKDIGTVLYEEASGDHATMLADKSRKGSAAGGTAKVEENNFIWHRLTE